MKYRIVLHAPTGSVVYERCEDVSESPTGVTFTQATPSGAKRGCIVRRGSFPLTIVEVDYP